MLLNVYLENMLDIKVFKSYQEEDFQYFYVSVSRYKYFYQQLQPDYELPNEEGSFCESYKEFRMNMYTF